MLDQNTDRMWYVIGAIIIGGLILTSSIVLFTDVAFAGIGNTFSDYLNTARNQPEYVLATDDDFRWVSLPGSSGSYRSKKHSERGHYNYIGDDEYVEIPNKINGDELTSYYRMFRGSGDSLKGVSSQNSKITSIRSMFGDTTFKELKVDRINTDNVSDMNGVFRNSDLELIDISMFNIEHVRTVYNTFNGSKLNTVYVGSEEAFELFENSDGKPTNLEIKLKDGG